MALVTQLSAATDYEMPAQCGAATVRSRWAALYDGQSKAKPACDRILIPLKRRERGFGRASCVGLGWGADCRVCTSEVQLQRRSVTSFKGQCSRGVIPPLPFCPPALQWVGKAFGGCFWCRGLEDQRNISGRERACMVLSSLFSWCLVLHWRP